MIFRLSLDKKRFFKAVDTIIEADTPLAALKTIDPTITHANFGPTQGYTTAPNDRAHTLHDTYLTDFSVRLKVGYKPVDGCPDRSEPYYAHGTLIVEEGRVSVAGLNEQRRLGL